MHKMGWFGVTQGHRQCHHSIERIRLPLSCSVFEKQRVSCRQSPTLPHPHLVPSLGWLRSNFQKIFGITKLQSLGSYDVVCSILCVAILVSACDRHTTTANTALAQRRVVKTETSCRKLLACILVAMQLQVTSSELHSTGVTINKSDGN